MASRPSYNLRDDFFQPLASTRLTAWSIVVSSLLKVRGRNGYEASSARSVEFIVRELESFGFRCEPEVIVTKLQWIRETITTAAEDPSATSNNTAYYEVQTLDLRIEMMLPNPWMEAVWQDFDLLIDLLFSEAERASLRRFGEVVAREEDAKREREEEVVEFYRCGGGTADVLAKNDKEWNNPLPFGGSSPVRRLEEWISTNYKLYCASDASNKSAMIHDLCKAMNAAGWSSYTETELEEKIDDMIREVNAEAGCRNRLRDGGDDYRCLADFMARR